MGRRWTCGPAAAACTSCCAATTREPPALCLLLQHARHDIVSLTRLSTLSICTQRPPGSILVGTWPSGCHRCEPGQ